MAETKTENKAVETKTAKEKKVKIILPITRYEKDDEFVGINGMNYQIKRGEEVEVPESVADALRIKEKQLAKALSYMYSVANDK